VFAVGRADLIPEGTSSREYTDSVTPSARSSIKGFYSSRLPLEIAEPIFIVSGPQSSELHAVPMAVVPAGLDHSSECQQVTVITQRVEEKSISVIPPGWEVPGLLHSIVVLDHRPEEQSTI
jgi:hypothetical protein